MFCRPQGPAYRLLLAGRWVLADNNVLADCMFPRNARPGQASIEPIPTHSHSHLRRPK